MTKLQDDRGIAMIVTMFMVLLLTVLGSTMMFVSRAETLSSLNYKTMSQARYAAESGLHAATNHLLFEYSPPTSTSTDNLAFYDYTGSPVRDLAGSDPIVLSSSDGLASNYPDIDVLEAFQTDSTEDDLEAGFGVARYTASARLVAMKVITDGVTNERVTLQTWEVTGRGIVGIAGSAGEATVEVSAIIERQQRPIYPYAAFAQDDGCDALKFGGGAITDSYNSNDPLNSTTGEPDLDNDWGNVGTNGNLSELGSTTTLHGSLSTPRTGVGNCTSGNVTGLSTSGNPTLDGGMIQLPQKVEWPTPPAPDPMPPTSNDKIDSGSVCADLPSLTGQCANSADGIIIQPGGNPVVLGDLSLGSHATVHLEAGTYIVNSLKMGAHAEIILDSGPVIFQVAGEGVATPIDMTGGTFSNDTYVANNFRFIYGGTGNIKMAGGSGASGVVYAPNASLSFTGQGEFYGAVLADTITDLGGAEIHYDKALLNQGLTAGAATMSSFTWKSF